MEQSAAAPAGLMTLPYGGQSVHHDQDARHARRHTVQTALQGQAPVLCRAGSSQILYTHPYAQTLSPTFHLPVAWAAHFCCFLQCLVTARLAPPHRCPAAGSDVYVIMCDSQHPPLRAAHGGHSLCLL